MVILKNSTILRFSAIALSALVVTWLGLYAYRSPEINNLIVMATTHQPETFTELYFENSANLPKGIISQELYNFTFTVHNLEGKDAIYPYTVYLQRGDIRAVIDQGVVAIKSNGYRSIQETMGPLSPFRKEVVVELTDKDQSISFWMNVE